MLLENINGKPFPFLFNNQGFISDAQIDKIHSQLAEFQHQLSRLTFKEIGQLYPDGSNGSVRVGPIVDRNGRRFGPFQSSRELYIARARLVLDEAKEEEDQRSAFLHLMAAQGMENRETPLPSSTRTCIARTFSWMTNATSAVSLIGLAVAPFLWNLNNQSHSTLPTT